MMNKLLIAVAVMFAATSTSMAANVSMTGAGQPFNNMQPSLVITEALAREGFYPSRDGNLAMGGSLGFVYQFAANWAPGTSQQAQGQILPIAQNSALFSILGTTYGGNGVYNFALPDLAGRAIIGSGTGIGLSEQVLGSATGSNSTTLSVANLPSHDHTLTSGGDTGLTGGGQASSNLQPSLPMRVVIALSGIFPSTGGGVSATFLGQIGTFVGNFVPGGWAEADGRLLSIAENDALFSVIGTTYGGDGRSTFALPNLQGRLAVGANSANPVGSLFGVESNTVNLAQLPAHDHVVADGDVTGTTGASQPLNNVQPSLAINYLVATEGIFPPREGGRGFFDNVPFLGQITQFAGDFAPKGWVIANGQTMSIAQNQALFSILGTTYGGNGTTTFALPDFRGRTAIGSGNGYDIGQIFGSEETFLTAANLPMHDHTAPDIVQQVPEPGTIALIFFGLIALGIGKRKQA